MTVSLIVTMILNFLGGLGMFLFGMSIMSDGLENAAGDSLSDIIEKMTNNKLKGVIAGAVVTGIIQSSAATTVMVIGFINASIMTLSQAVGVIMGANIGTTVTAQLLSLSEISSGAWYLAILNPTNFAPVLIGVGVFFYMFSSKKTLKTLGSILTGFGLLFIGMSTMEGAVEPLRTLDGFQNVFAKLTNPFLGVLVGAVVTAIIQSSSASVGILQAASSTGAVTFSVAAPIILGQNIGSCVTAMLSSIGASKNAKKAAVVHLSFNIVGTALFLIAIYSLKPLISFWAEPITKSGIANFHLIFNITNTIILLPFSNLLVKIADAVVRSNTKETSTEGMLDPRFLQNPSLAVVQAVRETLNMAELDMKGLEMCEEAILTRDVSKKEIMDENENAIDLYESNITRYLMKIVDENLSIEDSRLASSLFHVLVDLERIGDHCHNTFKIMKHVTEDDIHFSPLAQNELKTLMGAIKETLALAIDCYHTMDTEKAKRVMAYEHTIDSMRKHLRNHHIERMSSQSCNFSAAISFLDILGNLERISDHCANIATAVEQLMTENPQFDLHSDPKSFREENPDEYKRICDEFKAKYPIA